MDVSWGVCVSNSSNMHGMLVGAFTTFYFAYPIGVTSTVNTEPVVIYTIVVFGALDFFLKYWSCPFPFEYLQDVYIMYCSSSEKRNIFNIFSDNFPGKLCLRQMFHLVFLQNTSR